MTKLDLQKLIVECLHEYSADNAKPIKENSMTLKKSELKALVNEVVRQCIKEAGTQYKVQGKKSQLEQPGLRNKAREMQDDPEINEVAPPGGEDVVKGIKKSGSADNPWAVAWSMKNKGQIENESEGEIPGEEGEDEGEEIRLIKGLALISLKLLKMHQGMEEPEGAVGEPEGDGVPFKGPEAAEEPAAEEPASDEPEPPAEKEEEKDEVDENHKVQARSFKTVKDVEGNHPERTRKPSTPMS